MINDSRWVIIKYSPIIILNSKNRNFCKVTLNRVAFDEQNNILYEYGS